MHGAKIVFADIKSETLNIDETKLEKLITKKTRAIVAVHYAGIACEMKEIMRIGKKYNLSIIEDNAHGIFGEYYGKKLGSIGHLATQSFHETKNISCGEGGALIINNKKFYSRAEIIREKGTNRSRFVRGEVDKYTWVDKGSSYLLSDILSAVLLNQLKSSHKIQLRRKNIWYGYHNNLRDWCEKNNIIQPMIPIYCKQSYHMYYLLLPNKKLKEKFINYLSKLNIKASSHYQPLHSSPFIKKKIGFTKDNCPITTDISQRIVRLPMFYNMSNSQYSKVISDIINFHC
jgi:dTDP-4-amino-4,6-dideoxygalactose transaminase